METSIGRLLGTSSGRIFAQQDSLNEKSKKIAKEKKNLYNAKNKVIKLYDKYSAMTIETNYETIYGGGFKY